MEFKEEENSSDGGVRDTNNDDAGGNKHPDNLDSNIENSQEPKRSDVSNDILEEDDDSNEVEMASASETVESDVNDLRRDHDQPDQPPQLTDSDTEDEFSDALEDNSVIFKRRKLSNSRVYRRSNNNQDEDGAGSSGGTQPVAEPQEEDDEDDEIPELESTNEQEDSSSDSDEDGDEGRTDNDISALARDICSKTPSAPRHSLLRDLHLTQLGRQLRPSLKSRLCGSLDLVTRLHMVSKLTGHEGCVNSVSFNSAGDRIASGSDDLHIIVHDWQKQNTVVKFNTGHRANVFQSKMLPGDLLITSCSRDGQVRLAELSVTGALRSTRRLAQHKVTNLTVS